MKLVIYLPDLHVGGVPIVYIRLIPSLIALGVDVSILVNRRSGELIDRLPPSVDVLELGVDRQLKALPKLVPFLKEHKPDIILTAIEHMHIMTVLARLASGSKVKHLAVQHNPLSQQAKRPGLTFKILPVLYRFLLPLANGIAAVSKGVADDLSARAGIARSRIDVCYNGVVDARFDGLSEGELPPAWPETTSPLLINVGRFARQKDQQTLLRAFALVRSQPSPELVLLGGGEDEGRLRELARELGVDQRVHFLGYCANPLPAIKAADVFVLSSIYEGHPLVLLEALALGTPVVSTNCPYGPSEILADGKFGHLAPVGRPDALAEAIEKSLANPADKTELMAHGRAFTVENSAEQHVEIFKSLLKT